MKQQDISLERAPFLIILLPFITGISIRFYVPDIQRYIIPLMLLLTLILIAFNQTSSYFKFKFGWLRLLLWQLQILLSGMLIVWLRDEKRKPHWIEPELEKASSLIVLITEPPEKKEPQWVIQTEVVQLYLADSAQPATGNIKLYIKRESADPVPQYGDRLHIRNKVTPILSGHNPGAFDYKQYAHRQRLYYQANLYTGEWKVLSRPSVPSIKKTLYAFLEYILLTLRRHVNPEEAIGIAEALLLGYKQDLDRDLLQAYSRTGVVHIIAVSGMHLGIIYWLLTILFRPLQKWKKGKALQSVFILSGLWVFSLLAGAGPSVLRSALMFSCITIGNSFGMRSATYNSLAASAFLLLCYEPNWIFDIGFQLSYTAVASILFFQPILQPYFYVENKWGQHITSLIAVTLSAQILTLPLCLYHFHQFPVLFLLTNLIAVPLSSALLLLIIPLPLFHLWPVPADWWGKGIGYLILGMNRFIAFADALPFAVWEGLQVSEWQVALFYIGIAGATAWWLNRSRTGKWMVVLSLLGMALLRTASFMEASKKRQLIIYNIPRRSAAAFWSGRSVLVFHSDSLRIGDKQWNQQIRPSFTLYRAAGIQQRHPVPEFIRTGDGFTIYCPLRSLPASWDKNLPIPDLIWLQDNPRLRIAQLAAIVPVKQVVIDGSNHFKNRESWESECRSLNIPFHRTDLSGAFVKKR